MKLISIFKQREFVWVVIFLSVLGIGFLGIKLARREMQIRQVDVIVARMALFSVDDKSQLAMARQAIAMMGDRPFNHAPYMVAGDILGRQGNFKDAETYLTKALQLLDDPSFYKSRIITNYKKPKDFSLDRLLIQKRLEYVRAGRTWKDNEILEAVKDDLYRIIPPQTANPARPPKPE